ncbi:MAG: hypothetical protein ACYDCO_25965 [Armatimonadota bacterium]
MKTLRSRRMALAVGALVAVLGIALTGFFVSRAHAQEGGYANRVTLARDVFKLAIVVMANQTPISAKDAAQVVPALEAIRAEEVITEEEAAQLDAQLLSALSPELRSAVEKVRLPEPDPDVRARMQQFAERRAPGNPARYGPGSRAFGRLLEFFKQTAGE